MSRDLGRDVPDLEKLWADFSCPQKGCFGKGVFSEKSIFLERF